MRTAPPGQKRAQIAHPVQRDSSTKYPLAPGYEPPGMGWIAPRGHTRRAGQPGERSHAAASIFTFDTVVPSLEHACFLTR